MLTCSCVKVGSQHPYTNEIHIIKYTDGWFRNRLCEAERAIDWGNDIWFIARIGEYLQALEMPLLYVSGYLIYKLNANGVRY